MDPDVGMDFFFEMEMLKETLLKRPRDTRHEPDVNGPAEKAEAIRSPRTNRPSQGSDPQSPSMRLHATTPVMPRKLYHKRQPTSSTICVATPNALNGAGWEVHHVPWQQPWN